MKVLPNETKETIALFNFLLRHYKVMLIAVAASIVIAVVITFFIPGEYYAYGSVFPPNSSSLEATVDNPILGYDVEADRLIQILQSKEMQDILITKYDLISYYDLDTSDLDWRDQLMKKYFRDINFTRTIAMSVVISARTQDPELSANIVNTIIDSINPMRERVIKNNFNVALQAFHAEYTDQKLVVDSLLKKISSMRDEIRDPQLTILASQQMNISMAGRNGYQNSTALEKAINEYLFEQAMLNEITKRYYKAKMAFERPITSVYVLDRATVSYKKVYPSFVINIVIAALGAFLASWIILFLFEKGREMKKDSPS